MEEKKYVTEWANENLGLTLKITNMVHEEQTPFQHIQIADTLEYGRLLILDGVFQTSVKDEWTYHEMISHVPLMLHPHPERVLIIGGGDGGVARKYAATTASPMWISAILTDGSLNFPKSISPPFPRFLGTLRKSSTSMWETALPLPKR